MRLQHPAGTVRAVFDDPNLLSCAGLEPVMRLAEQVGLHGLVDEALVLPGSTGSNPSGKVAAIIAGMLAGADSIDDCNLIRHGGMRSLFTGVYAPSTLGSFLRTFTHGHALQLHAAARNLLVCLADRVDLLSGVGQLCFIDIDSMLRRVYGKQKQGAGFGHAKVGGYDVRLRGRAAADARTMIADLPVNNVGSDLESFLANWDGDGSATLTLDDGSAGTLVVGGALYVCSAIVLALKVNVIVQLTLLAIEICQALATAVPSGGLSLVEVPVFKRLTSMAIDYLVNEALEVVLG